MKRGGTGEGFEIYQKLHGRNRTLRESVRRCDVGIIASDAFSAGWAFTGFAIGAALATGPVGVGALWVVGWASAGASGWAALNCPM